MTVFIDNLGEDVKTILLGLLKESRIPWDTLEYEKNSKGNEIVLDALVEYAAIRMTTNVKVIFESPLSLVASASVTPGSRISPKYANPVAPWFLPGDDCVFIETKRKEIKSNEAVYKSLIDRLEVQYNEHGVEGEFLKVVYLEGSTHEQALQVLEAVKSVLK